MTEDITFARWRDHARDEHKQHRPVLERTIIHEDGVVTDIQMRLSAEGPLDLEDYVRTTDRHLRLKMIAEVQTLICPPTEDCDKQCPDCIRYQTIQRVVGILKEGMDDTP